MSNTEPGIAEGLALVPGAYARLASSTAAHAAGLPGAGPASPRAARAGTALRPHGGGAVSRGAGPGALRVPGRGTQVGGLGAGTITIIMERVRLDESVIRLQVGYNWSITP